jgi:alanyl aminopeptidase
VLRVFALLFAALPAAAAPTLFLPDNVTPAQFWIDLYIDPNQPIFEGTEQIEVHLKQATSVIWLNAKDLSFHNVGVEWNGEKRAARVETSGNEFAGFHVDPQIGPGRAKLSIRYRGELNEKLPVGPFRKKTGVGWSVYTTFTPIDARRAFPCFDEPRFKTKWNLTLHVRREHEAFANSPSIRTTEEPGGWKAVQFAPTEPLPAELVAFAVGRFDRLDGGRVGRNRIPVGVITPPGRHADGEAAAQATHDLLPRLEAYTGIPYPYQKLDHIALPRGRIRRHRESGADYVPHGGPALPGKQGDSASAVASNARAAGT